MEKNTASDVAPRDNVFFSGCNKSSRSKKSAGQAEKLFAHPADPRIVSQSRALATEFLNISAELANEPTRLRKATFNRLLSELIASSLDSRKLCNKDLLNSFSKFREASPRIISGFIDSLQHLPIDDAVEAWHQLSATFRLYGMDSSTQNGREAMTKLLLFSTQINTSEHTEEVSHLINLFRSRSRDRSDSNQLLKTLSESIAEMQHSANRIQAIKQIITYVEGLPIDDEIEAIGALRRASKTLDQDHYESIEFTLQMRFRLLCNLKWATFGMHSSRSSRNLAASLSATSVKAQLHSDPTEQNFLFRSFKLHQKVNS